MIKLNEFETTSSALQAHVAEDDWMVDVDNYEIREDDGHLFVRHNILDGDGEQTGCELEFGENHYLYSLKEELYETNLTGDKEKFWELKERLLGETVEREHDDVFDYESEASVLINGVYI